MNRKEMATTLKLLKEDKSEQKGFSFRRTIKTLQEAKRNKTIYNYWKELHKGEDFK